MTTQNTPRNSGSDGLCASAMSCFRSPLWLVMMGMALSFAQACTRRLNRPANLMRLLVFRFSSPPNAFRHQFRKPPGVWMSRKYAFRTRRSTQS